MHVSTSHSRRLLTTLGRFGTGLAATLIAATALAQSIVVDLNAASAAELASTISGVGPAKAAAIVEYRDAYGDFEQVDDLIDVPGIGLRTIERNRDRLTVGGAVPAATDTQAALVNVD